ncbi:MAG: electron transfer flavoprotein subunit beta/FixA family protein [Desulfuromonadales bacterium]|jgi:electron transfer flavoprotein beta subunit
MKIAVLVKSVPDTAGTPEIGPDGRSVVTEHLETVLNPYDEIAVEEAVRMKEALGAEVVAVGLGDEAARKALRTAFAMGADAAVLARRPEEEPLTGKGAALCLAPVLRELRPDLILAGKQAVDDDGAQVAERVAEMLGYLHASAVTRLAKDGAQLVVDREIEGGALSMEFPLPAVLTVEKGLNTPRYPTLPQILKAKRREIREVAVDGEGVRPGWRVDVLSLPDTQRRRQIFQGTVTEQVDNLLREARPLGGLS